MIPAPLTKWWTEFWFTPTSPAPICLFRIFFGLLVLATGLLLAPDLYTWFGSHPVISQQSVHDWELSEPRFSIFFFLPDSDSIALSVFATLMVSASCLTLGLFTRVSALVVFVCLCSLDQRMACMMNSGDTILRHQALLLTFSEAGALFSLDRIRSRSKQSQSDQSFLVSPWAQRLLQLQIALVYFQTFFSKLEHPQWLDGTALYYCSRLTDFARSPSPILFDHLWIYQVLCWMTLAVELALFTLIWWQKTRYPVLIIGTIFHLCIDATMNIPVFEYIMMASYINFLKPADVFRLKKWCAGIWPATKL
ncbi:hypothetical protein BH10CYA1_BH10CYA1_46790 [soil metagenome]